MIEAVLTALFSIAAIAAALVLADSAIRARYAFVSLKRERALLNAGFVPQVEQHALRLRNSQRHFRGASTRPFARRVPQPARLAV